MKAIGLAAILAATLAAGTRAASAQNYPWCLVDDLKSGAWSCAFVSWEQCQMSTGGNVGHCVANPGYPGVPGPVRRPRRSHG
jgi:hypothetical protein